MITLIQLIKYFDSINELSWLHESLRQIDTDTLDETIDFVESLDDLFGVELCDSNMRRLYRVLITKKWQSAFGLYEVA